MSKCRSRKELIVDVKMYIQCLLACLISENDIINVSAQLLIIRAVEWLISLIALTHALNYFNRALMR